VESSDAKMSAQDSLTESHYPLEKETAPMKIEIRKIKRFKLLKMKGLTKKSEK